MRQSTNLWFSILIPQLSPLPRTLQSLLSPITHPPPAQHPISLCLQNKHPPSPSPLPRTPCSHIPLSRAAAVHKYINLVSACTCVRTWRQRVDGWSATLQAGPLLCPITDAQRSHIRPIQPDPAAASREPVAQPVETGRQTSPPPRLTWTRRCQPGPLI